MSVAIYLRTSTTEQDPKMQKEQCISLAEDLGFNDYEIFEEKKSAWKNDNKREIFNEIYKKISKRKINVIIVWDLDRLYRNRRKLVYFFELCKNCDCKIYSVRQKFLQEINNAPEPWNEMLFNNMIFIFGWIAEEESNKKSERVRMALIKNGKATISKYGKVWGRKALPEKTKKMIIELHEQGKSYREICSEAYYWDASKHRKNVSMGAVHKILAENKREIIAK